MKVFWINATAVFAVLLFATRLVADEPLVGGCWSPSNFCVGFSPCPKGTCVPDGTIDGINCGCGWPGHTDCNCYGWN